VLWKYGTVKFFETLANNVFHDANLKKKLMMGKNLG
jgi:hypothetical protein